MLAAVAAHDLLVTGSRGFVGRWVSERAVRTGLSVAVADDDLRSPAACERLLAEAKPAAVIHAAASPRSLPAWQSLADDIAMSGNLIGAVARHVPQSPVLIPGSAAQYGMGGPGRLSEQAPVKPVSAYGAAKCVLEQAVLADPLRQGVRVIWARTFNLVGPRQRNDAPAAQWTRQIVAAEHAAGGPLRTGRLDVVRDFLDVRDLADAYIALVGSAAAAGVVNVCSGEPLPLSALAQAMIDTATVGVTLELDHDLRRRLDPPRVVGDPGRLRALTEWRPALGLSDSVREMLDECREAVGASVVR